MASGKLGKIGLAIALSAIVVSSLACGSSQRVDLATADVVEESAASEVQESESSEAVVLEEPTKEATAIPEPTSEPVASLEILSSNSYVDSAEFTHVVGEVQNTGGTDLALVEVVASFYDADSNFIAGGSSYTSVGIVNVNEIVPFHILESDIGDFASYDLQVQGQPADTFTYAISYRDFEIVDDSMVDGDYAKYVIRGQIRNIGDMSASVVRIIATLHDSNGEVVGVESGLASIDLLNPDALSPFEIAVFTTAGESVDYSLVAEGVPTN